MSIFFNITARARLWIGACAALGMAACSTTAPTPTVTQAPPLPQDLGQQEPMDARQITDPIHVAVVLPLSGPQSRLGEAMAQAVQMAFFEAQDPRLSLTFFDSLGAQATLQSRQALGEEIRAYGPQAVIGPLFSETAQAIAPALLADNVPVLSFSNDIAANASGAILLGQQPEQEVARVLSFIASEAETRRLGLIVPDDIYGMRVRKAMLATVDALNEAVVAERQQLLAAREAAVQDDEMFGGTVTPEAFGAPVLPPALDGALMDAVAQDTAEDIAAPIEPLTLFDVMADQSYTRDLRALDGPARRIAEFDARVAEMTAERAYLTDLGDPMGLDYLDSIRNEETFRQPHYDILLVGEGGQLLRALAPLLTVYAIDEKETQLIGTGLWNDPALTREPALHGGLFAAAPAAATQRFARAYQAQFGSMPPALAATAYDAMAILALAARDNSTAPALFEPSRLFRPSGFQGASGLFRLLPSGIAERTLAVLKITETGLETVDPAPTSFPLPQVDAGADEPQDPVSR